MIQVKEWEDKKISCEGKQVVDTIFSEEKQVRERQIVQEGSSTCWGGGLPVKGRVGAF